MAILAGYGGTSPNRSRLLVFKLGGTGKLPPVSLSQDSAKIPPPPFTGTSRQVANGAKHYARYCIVCHLGTYNNPLLGDSPILHDADAMKAIVIGGALSHTGMVSFRSALTDKDAEAIRQYLIKSANEKAAPGD